MLLVSVRFAVCALMWSAYCDGQFVKFSPREKQSPPVPFPTCRADNIDCLRRGLRSFFVLMDTGHMGMKPIDPLLVNSVAVALPEQQMSILLRRANVTGARWTRLMDRRFDLNNGKSGTTFSSDLHVTGEVNVKMATRVEPYVAFITMDIQEAESNVTYNWRALKGIDNEDYILIGPERIAIRNFRTPTFFLQPNTQDAASIDSILQAKPNILDHLSNEITAALMHSIVDNFRLFASSVPVKYYYKYYEN